MKWLPGILALALLTGCVPVPQIRSAPVPLPQEVEASRSQQSRVVNVPYEAVFPRVLDVLLDAGYLVRSADRELGIVSIYQQWRDVSQPSHPDLVQEGTLLFRSEGPDRTSMRVALSGKWEVLSIGGPKSSDAIVSAVQQNVDVDVYRQLLDVLEQGLLKK